MYNIQILSDKEFDSLPYPETEASLGIADPKTNTAFVRHTASDDLNKYLVNHELEHLIEGHGGKHSEHYRNGVYYKAWLVPLISALFTGAATAGGSMLFNKAFGPKPPQQQQQAFAQQEPQMAFSSQQGQRGSFLGGSGNVGGSMGASGGTGALGQMPVGSAVDKLRSSLQSVGQTNFLKGNYAGRGPI